MALHTFTSSPFKAMTASGERCLFLSHLRIKAKEQRAGYLKAPAGQHKALQSSSSRQMWELFFSKIKEIVGGWGHSEDKDILLLPK